MPPFLGTCIVGYMVMVVIWFLVETFLFEMNFKQACFGALFWPVLVWKVKSGRKRMPNSNYSEGTSRYEFKQNPLRTGESQNERNESCDPSEGECKGP